ncbi:MULTISPECIES: RidA family protein [Pseudomonas]|jgi:enamine deaminase RidA (YjgF/YER057c/UK114 family)|uniref:RidA family protein n=1 Tax=Pseudomonas TaxID=286 RepID=UPI0020C2516B|nr:RidA family protein [Pseudomonas fluorescens]MDI9776500.1 RidA family protein [Pseudomonas putida]UTL89275.1 RidA family protein [Pseudomonas fluorescens]
MAAARPFNDDTAYWGVPWEDSYGYPQVRRAGNVLFVSGQFSHDEDGSLVAPAPLDADGRPSDFSSMGEQMRVCYANIAKLLALYGAGLEDVVEETLYVLDMDAAFAVVGKVRKAAYGSDRPQAASNIIGVSRLAQRPQLIEIVCRAVIGAPAS